MPDKTGIEWTDTTWNPVTGCTKISPGCAHCYAEAITLRFKRGGPFLPGKTTNPAARRPVGPSGEVANATSSLREQHERTSSTRGVPFDFVDKVFASMSSYADHTYQILTKRPERMLEYARSVTGAGWPDHVWAGVSVENQRWADQRIPLLQQVPTAVRFLSCEPLLKPLKLDLTGNPLGHRGRRKRTQSKKDARVVGRGHQDPVRSCARGLLLQAMGRPHQQGGRGRLLHGREWGEMPSDNENPPPAKHERRALVATAAD